MPVEVIVLNGGSSSGKSTIARHLQSVLLQPWLTFGVDSLIEAMPPSLQDGGVEVRPDGQVVVGPAFRALEVPWMAGIAAMARAGARIIIEDVFLGGGSSQRRWSEALDGLGVLWVGVRCDAEVAARRELGRGDREAGMAASQAAVAHQGVSYDMEVDTTRTGTRECALAIATHLG